VTSISYMTISLAPAAALAIVAAGERPGSPWRRDRGEEEAQQDLHGFSIYWRD
jgi:hypothetical protein